MRPGPLPVSATIFRMPDYQFKLVDAFTSERYAGNSCGVVTDARGLSDEQMQAIAREINSSETAFVTPSAVADFRVRFFTPTKEIPLAGHPTIATMHALAEEGRIDLADGSRRVTQELNVGVLPVDVSRDDNGSIRVVMTQAKPAFERTVLSRDAAAALGIAETDLLPGHPVQVVSTGTPQLMVPLNSMDALRRLQPRFELLQQIEQAGRYFSTHVFTLETLDPVNRAHSRHYLLGSSIIEDPVTGSASGGMAAYLWKYGLVRAPRYAVEQGHIMGRPGIVDIEVDGDGDEPQEVRIAGTAVTVLAGTLTV